MASSTTWDNSSKDAGGVECIAEVSIQRRHFCDCSANVAARWCIWGELLQLMAIIQLLACISFGTSSFDVSIMQLVQTCSCSHVSCSMNACMFFLSLSASN